MMKRISLFYVCLICLLVTSAAIAQQQSNSEVQKSQAPKVEKAELGQTSNVHKCRDLYLTGQFATDDIKKIKDAGIKRVITLRTDGEIEWDEQSAVEQAELLFMKVPFRAPDSLNDEVFDKVRKLLADEETATLFHCGSANRVGAVWLPFRVLDQGVPLETALEEAYQIGLRNESYEERALDYISRKQAEAAKDRQDRSEASVRPGINDNFLDPDLNVDSFIKRFEIESREVFSSRMEVLKACNIQPGWRVADVGAGTGLYTRLFAPAVGDDGWIFALDIAPRFVEHIRTEADKSKLTNITPLLCAENSISLPPNSIDFAFICDTYHHFEYPNSTLASIFNALKPGGQLVVIDFKRIPGQTRQWLLDHVRAGQEVFRSEIEGAGFHFVEQVAVAGFEENYFLRFRKPMLE